jgi:5-enolpyruvylshikimate-3-phosphate synthase
MKIPPSKSHTMRALFFRHLAKKDCQIENILDAPEVQEFKKNLENWDEIDRVDVKNSGLALHFLIALATLRCKKTFLTGDYSICNLRPVEPLISALCTLGAKVTYHQNRGLPPLTIEGPIKNGKVHLDGTNSQHVSSLLIALSQVEGKSEITVTNPCEKPYIEITLDWLKKLGFAVENRDFFSYSLEGPFKVPSFAITIPADFSSLAFLVAVNKILEIKEDFSGLDFQDLQGDKRLFFYLNQEKCCIKDTPDLLPVLMVLALYKKGPSLIHGIHVARQKESDRPFAMKKELEKMGAKIEIYEKEDYMYVQPGPLFGAKLTSHNDHRIAMSLAVAALKAHGTTTIEGVQCVSKSFPNFFETFCPDWAAKIGKDDTGQVTIEPARSEICRS